MKYQQQEWSPGIARSSRPAHTKEIVEKELAAYPADTVCVERASDPKTFIVTLTAADGFEVSFSLTGQQLNTLGEANTSWMDIDFVQRRQRSAWQMANDR
jgi:hypothetical protein